MIYLKFDAPEIKKEEAKSNKVKEFIVNAAMKILKQVIPEANPDYNHKIDKVKVWLVEIDDETQYPNREIGIDKDGSVIIIMPDERNYGYWTENNLKEEDFKSHFETEEISEKAFNQLWEEFENKKEN
ncbi:MAG: hypothetical protein AAF960_20310 [Bacteroidota bacterium]